MLHSHIATIPASSPSCYLCNCVMACFKAKYSICISNRNSHRRIRTRGKVENDIARTNA